LVILLGLAGTAAAQDAVQAKIENEWVHVVRVKFPSHAKLALLPGSVLVCLTDAHQRLIGVDGTVRDVMWKAGDVVYLDVSGQTAENVADQPLEAVLIQLKPGAPKSPPITLDPVKLDPKHHIVVLENERVRALRTILEPHLKSPMHEHPHYVVVYLTDLHTTMTLGDGRSVDNPRRPGEIAWRDALKHITENIGDHTAVEIQVELK
jgi:hypothetical protein